MTRNTRRHKTIAYDPDGNRTVKEHGGGEAVWVNSKHAGTMTDTVTCSIYPYPYININGNRWTKHYYIGGERIASMTGTISCGFEGLNATGNSAITFNAAALSNKTKKYLRLNHKEASIKAIVVEGEILDYLQRNKLNMHAEGTIKYLKASYLPPYTQTLREMRTLQRINNHSIGTVRRKLKS